MFIAYWDFFFPTPHKFKENEMNGKTTTTPRTALDILKENGCTSGSFINSEGKMCAMGAIVAKHHPYILEKTIEEMMIDITFYKHTYGAPSEEVKKDTIKLANALGIDTEKRIFFSIVRDVVATFNSKIALGFEQEMLDAFEKAGI